MGEGSNMNETMASRSGNSTSRSLSASRSASARGSRPSTAPAPQRTSNSAIRQRVAEKKKLVEAQFLGRESKAAPKDLPPFWSTQIHGVPYNEGDPLDLARGAMTTRGTLVTSLSLPLSFADPTGPPTHSRRTFACPLVLFFLSRHHFFSLFPHTKSTLFVDRKKWLKL